MLFNIPINELSPNVEVWLPLCVTVAHQGITKQGKRYYDAIGQNKTGRIALKCWQETIEKSGELRSGLCGVTGKLTYFQEQAQFLVTSYELISVDTYREHQQADPILPRAFTVDIETVPLPEYRARARALLRRSYRNGSMKPDQQERYEKDAIAEEKRAYAQGALFATSGRVLCIAVHIAPKAEYKSMNIEAQECVIGIDEEGREQTEKVTLTRFLRLLEGFDREMDEIVGHGVIHFDWPFILQRCVVHNIRAPAMFDLSAYHVRGIYDTCQRWFTGVKNNGAVSLDALAFALGLESSKTNEISGDKIFALYQQGRLLEIRDYNLRDVRLTRKIYERIVLTLGR